MGRYLHAMLHMRLLPAARSFPSKRIQSILQGVTAFGLGLVTYFEVSSSGCALFFLGILTTLVVVVVVVVVVVGNALDSLDF